MKKAIIVGLMTAWSVASVSQVNAQTLMQRGDMVYKGAFRVPKGKYGNTARTSSLSFGGHSLTFKSPTASAPNGSIFMSGKDGFFIELGVPEIINPQDRTACTTNDINCLRTATVLQGSFDLTGGKLQRTGSGGEFIVDEGQMDGATPVKLISETMPSGLLVHGDSLIGSVVTPYDPNIKLSHFKANTSWDTSVTTSSNFKGFFRVGEHPTNTASSNVGMVGGYMTHIPAEWQSALGGPALTGWVVESVISRSSFGPTVSAFDPSVLGKVDPTPSTLLLGYPVGYSNVLGTYSDDAPNHIFNKNSRVKGVAFPVGTGSVIFFGSTGLGVTGEGDTCYGQGTADLSQVADKQQVTDWIIANGTNYVCGSSSIKLTSAGIAENPCCFDRVRTTVKGPHGYPYIYRAWVYDANDFADVKSGKKQPWDVVPYAVWDLNSYSITPNVSYAKNSGPFDLPFAVEDAHILGAAFDPATNRIYISQMAGDKPGLEPYPLVHVFEVRVNSTTDVTPPTIVITSPAREGSVGGTVSVSTIAKDNVGVTRTELYVDDVLKASISGTGSINWATATVPDGSHLVYVKAYDAVGNVGQSPKITVTVDNSTLGSVMDVTAPTVTAFAIPTTATSLTVPVTTFTAADAGTGVKGYLITESQSAPLATAGGWSGTAPTSFTFSGTGVRTAYAWAKDAAGNVSGSVGRTVTITPVDTTAPQVTSFSMPATATTTTVPVTALSASDTIGVTGYLITEGSTIPSLSAAGWSATRPTSYTFSSAGVKTAYAWAKDAAGNLSNGVSAQVTITLPDTTAPVVSAFTMPATSSSLSVPVSTLTATDNVAVTGYRLSESATAPTASSTGWSSSAPTSFTFAATGSRTLYVWAKDAAGNVSAARSASVSIASADTVAPQVTGFTMPATYKSRTVPVSVSATDAVGVTAYRISESSAWPTASSTGWSATLPTSFTFAGTGTRTAYVWAKDAAGNISAAKSATTIVDVTLPVITSVSVNGPATSLSVKASATDNIAVSTMQLYIDSATTPVLQVSGSTLNYLGSITKGSHTLTVKAYDKAGNMRSQQVNVTK